MKTARTMDKLRIEREEAELEQVKRKEAGWSHPIDKLLDVANAWYIDNSKSLTPSEPAICSLWTDEEMEEIKFLILKKARRL